MDFCNWLRQEGGYYRCEVCGFMTKLENVVRKCKQLPDPLTRIGNFIPAFASHLMTGSRKCSKEEIESRLKVCKGCPLFIDNACNHNSCGCSVSDKQVFLNKLYWADQECPVGKWEKV